MNTRKFVLWQIKKWLPLVIVTLATLTTIFLISVLFYSTTHRVYYSDLYATVIKSSNQYSTPLGFLFYPTLVFTFIYPWAAYSYHFTKNSADAYRQFSVDNRRIRNIKFLLALGLLIASFTVAYIIGMASFFGKLASTPEESFVSTNTAILRNEYSALFLILEYLYLVVVIVLQYSFNTFLISLCGTSNAALVILIVGNVALSSIYPALFLLTSKFGQFNTYCGILSYAALFHGLIDPAASNDLHILADPFLLIGLGITLTLSIASLVGFLLMKDPSGEHYGTPGSRFKLTSLIIDGSLIVGSFLIGRGLSFFLWYLIFLVVIAFALYYAINTLYKKSPKVSAKEWIVMTIALIVSIIGYLFALKYRG